MNSNSGLLFQIFVIFLLILMNAFFAASEIAIVSLNRTKISLLAEDGDKKAQLLLKLMEEPSRFLATIQVGITLGGFFASASAATSLSQPLAFLLSSANIPGSAQIALITVTIILSYFTLVLGELFPKRMALQNAEDIAMFAVNPIILISKVTAPFVKILTLSTNFLVKVAGIQGEGLDEKISREEIRLMINAGEENGVINEIEKDMLDNIFEFDDTIAREIMTPRVNVFTLDITLPVSELLNRVLEEQYSRVPVFENQVDNIIGILYMKDLFIESYKDSFDEERIRQLLRPAYFVPETKNIDKLFRELQHTQNHMAILMDEYGAFSGIVTIEDLIEEVMGNIFDEHDENHNSIVKIDENNYIIDGFTDIDEINEILDLNIPSKEFDTIGGFMVNLLGYIPAVDDRKSIEFDNITFAVEEVERNRILAVRITKK